MHINRHAGPTASITRDVQKLELIELMMFEMFFRGFFQGGEPNIVRTGLALYSSMMAVELSAHDCHDATQRRSLQAVVDAVASIVKLEMVEMESRLKAELLSIQLPVTPAGSLASATAAPTDRAQTDRLRPSTSMCSWAGSLTTELVPKSSYSGAESSLTTALFTESSVQPGERSTLADPSRFTMKPKESDAQRSQRQRCERVLEKYANDAVYGKNNQYDGETSLRYEDASATAASSDAAHTFGSTTVVSRAAHNFLERRRRKHDFAVEHTKELPHGVLHPSGNFRQRWDATAIALVLYLSITLPYRLAFVEHDVALLLAIDVVIDVFFLLDLAVNATTAYYHEDHLVSGRRAIVQNYVTSWLVADLVASFPVRAFHSDPHHDRLLTTATLSAAALTTAALTTAALSPPQRRIRSTAALRLSFPVESAAFPATRSHRLTGYTASLRPAMAAPTTPRHCVRSRW